MKKGHDEFTTVPFNNLVLGVAGYVLNSDNFLHCFISKLRKSFLEKSRLKQSTFKNRKLFRAFVIKQSFKGTIVKHTFLSIKGKSWNYVHSFLFKKI